MRYLRWSYARIPASRKQSRNLDAVEQRLRGSLLKRESADCKARLRIWTVLASKSPFRCRFVQGMLRQPGARRTEMATPEESKTPKSEYVLGHTDRERRRLSLKASILNPLTDSFLRRAGVSAGMNVFEASKTRQADRNHGAAGLFSSHVSSLIKKVAGSRAIPR